VVGRRKRGVRWMRHTPGRVRSNVTIRPCGSCDFVGSFGRFNESAVARPHMRAFFCKDFCGLLSVLWR